MNKVSDINTRLADEREQRLRRIRLIERETAEYAPIWQAKQISLYPTAVPITQTPTLGQVITEEIQKNAMNSDVLSQRAEQKLLQLADKTNTEYILDRLEDQDLFYLVNSWDGIVKELKEKYNTKQLDKNVFIALVKKNSEDIKNQFQNINVNDLTTRGKTKKQQKEEELQKIQDAIDEENVKDEAEKQKQGAERLQQVKDEEAQELADKQQQLLAKIKMRKLKNKLTNFVKSKRNPPSFPQNDDPFIYDPNNDILTGKYEADFLKEYGAEENVLNGYDNE